MSPPGRIATLLFALAFLAPVTEAGNVVVRLRTGNELEGTIVAENSQEIELRLDDGMTMKLRRAVIAEIRPAGGKTEPPAPDRPAPEEPVPETPGAPVKRQEPGPPDPAPRVGEFRLFSKSPTVDWDVLYSRQPVLTVSRLARFRAYEHEGDSALAISPHDKTIRDLVYRYGHSGILSIWDFHYAGMQELRFGDEVKFIAELTSPEEEDSLLIRLREGPTPFAPRLAVMLVRSDGVVRRYATTTVFDARDFRQTDITALRTRPMPVRTFSDTWEVLATSWLTPEETRFLEGIQSSFGETLRVRIERYRFRIRWLATPPAERPPLDAALVERNTVRPLALEGRPAASDEYVGRVWGSLAMNREQLERLRSELAGEFAKIGVTPGRSYYVEWDPTGLCGSKGISLETRRLVLTEELLRELLLD